MNSTLLIAAAVLLVALVALIAFIATRPAAFRYTRSATIAAAPEALFDQINDLRKFQAWNPWAAVDPHSVVTFSGPPSGVGSSFAWKGNKNVGEGAMTITESTPSRLVRARMDFRKPFAATHTAEFTFTPEAGRTVVTWSMEGNNNFMGKVVGALIDCDKMVGGQFARGLTTLKDLMEG